MGYGNCVLTLATPENVEVVGEAGIPYADAADLESKLRRVLSDGAIVNAYRQRAQQRVSVHYDWERVVDRYENLFARMARQPEPHDERFAAEAEPVAEAAAAATAKKV
jgi:glycosyltransferase involved in cell wall biosynthesis